MPGGINQHLARFSLNGRGPWSYVLSWPGNLAVAAGVLQIPIVRDLQITNIAARVAVAPTGASAIFDLVGPAGTLWDSNPANRPTITTGTNADLTSLCDLQTLAAGDWLRLDVVQIGTTVPGAGAVIIIEYI